MAGYGDYLKRLLLPLRVYDLSEGSVNESELYALGAGLDEISSQLDTVEREAILTTAEDSGLSQREALFARRPAAPTTELRRAAIIALLQIGGDSLTLEAINRSISGCGIWAEVQETENQGYVRVIFPDTAGEPAQFEQIRDIILDIIPLHLETEFYFRYMTWEECESAGWTWERVEAESYTWESFQISL